MGHLRPFQVMFDPNLFLAIFGQLLGWKIIHVWLDKPIDISCHFVWCSIRLLIFNFRSVLLWKWTQIRLDMNSEQFEAILSDARFDFTWYLIKIVAEIPKYDRAESDSYWVEYQGKMQRLLEMCWWAILERGSCI